MSASIDSNEKDNCVYEVNITIDSALRDEFCAWLNDHIDEMLCLTGFEQAFVLEQETVKDTATYRCTVHYVLSNRQALQSYFDDHAQRMRAQGAARFGTALKASRRILASRAEHFAPTADVDTFNSDPGTQQITCLDCDTQLHGQYCYRCGQRDQRKLVSLGELVGDLVHDLASWDARLWRTVWPLLTRPGHLTQAYLQGQRMRFSPPLRMYLIASILFFLVASVGPQMAIRNMEVNGATSTSNELQVTPSETETMGNSPPLPAADEMPLADGPAAMSEPQAAPSGDDELSDVHAKCANVRTLTSPVFQDFLRERAYQSCLRITTPEGLRSFGLEMLDNLPTTLFFLLPLMAFVNKFLYLFSKRYYVEHLLFYVHSFSFLFVFSTLIIVLSEVADALSLEFFGWVVALAVIYVIYYFMRAMRVVYGQSRTVTFLKWLVINIVFVGLSMTTLGILALVTAAMFT